MSCVRVVTTVRVSVCVCVRVCVQADDEVGSFARGSGDGTSRTQLSQLCHSVLAEVHDFAFKMCGLASSVQDTHALHRYEVCECVCVLLRLCVCVYA